MYVFTGAGFLYESAGEILTMPDLPTRPAFCDRIGRRPQKWPKRWSILSDHHYHVIVVPGR